MTLKSHSLEEIRSLLKGDPRLKVFDLDTGTSGDDDVIVGVSREGVLRDVLAYHDLDALPNGWTLREMELDELEDYE